MLESWGPQLEESVGAMGHDDFVSATAAIVGSFGKDANEHYHHYINWCGYIGRNTDPNTKKTWRSFLKGTSVGWSRLCRLAGYQDDPAPLSHDALALRFAELHREDMRFAALWKKWLQWSGDRWQIDERLHAMTLARRVCRQAVQEYPMQGERAV